MANDDVNYPDLIPLIWQFDNNASPNVNQRIELYGVNGFPDCYWGGNQHFLGYTPNIVQFYTQKYNSVAEMESPVEMTTTFSVTTNSQYIIRTNIVQTDTLETTNNKVLFILTYDFSPDEEPDYFCSVVYYQEQDYNFSQTNYQQIVELDPQWDISKIKAVVILQTFGFDNAIIQASTADFQNVGVSENTVSKPILRLSNYPNPFNPQNSFRGKNTTIEFYLNSVESETATIKVFNVKGNIIKKLTVNNPKKGKNNVIWNGKDEMGKIVASGIYFYQLKIGNYSKVNKLMIVK